jgi:hypothetical protein
MAIGVLLIHSLSHSKNADDDADKTANNNNNNNTSESGANNQQLKVVKFVGHLRR